MTSRSVTRVEWFAAALVAALAPSHVRAQVGDPVELTWRAPAECPTADDVRERIRKLAGTTGQGEPLQAEATVEREASGRLHLTLVVRRGSSNGERHIEGKSCDDLAGAAAVNLALLLRSGAPLGAAGPQEAQSQPSDAREPAAADAAGEAQSRTAPEPAPEPDSPPSAEDQIQIQGLLQAPLLALGIGPMPEPSLGLALAGGVSVDRWRFLVEATAWLRQELSAVDPLPVSARVDRIEAGLRTCRDFPLGQVELGPCAMLSVVHLWARGSGQYVDARTDQSTWMAAALGGEARLLLTGWLRLAGRADVQIQTARPSISIDGAETVGRVGLLAVKITLGSEWIF